MGGEWLGTDGPTARFVAEESRRAVESYKVRPELIGEQSNIEQSTVQGGYGRSQLNELVQNAADAMDGLEGRISIILADDVLYCANEGQSFQDSGFRTLMLSHSSEKRDDQIGRFGLGFKSVLEITDTPQIFSRSASVQWDKLESEAILRSIDPDVSSYPVLRIAQPVDPMVAASKDPVLADLMTWASTVVRLPLKKNVTWLSEEMTKFPSEFLLFSDQIGTLELIDRPKNSMVRWTAHREGIKVILSDGTENTEWRVFHGTHSVSPMAASDAGSIVARDSVDVAWAVPMGQQARQNLGTFWNYFPTKSQMTLRGIVNAAFKMNADRHSMLDGLYNSEILTQTLPRIVAMALPEIQDQADPGSHFDVLPARGRESRSWGDEVINLPVMKAVASVPCIPDRSGVLRFASDIFVQPTLDEAVKLEDIWEAFVGPDRPWVHRSAFKRDVKRDRNPQVNRILELNQRKRASVTQWLEELVQSGNLDGYETALQLAAVINKRYVEYNVDMRRAHIVLAADGSVQMPITSRLFIPMDGEDPDSKLISFDLIQHGNVLEYLKSMDFQALDNMGKVNRAVRLVTENYEDPETAESLWRLSRTVQVPQMLQILSDRGAKKEDFLVRCRDGRWRPLRVVWVTGELFPLAHSDDADLLVDEQFHRHDMKLLAALNIRRSISAAAMTKTGALYAAWKDSESKRLSTESLSGPAPVSPNNMTFPQVLCTAGIELLAEASPRIRARVTAVLLQYTHYEAIVEYNHAYRATETIAGPDIWWIRHFGILSTPIGQVPTKYCVGPVDGIPTSFLPLPEDEDLVRKLGLTKRPSPAHWAYIVEAAKGRLSVDQIHEVYGLMAKGGFGRPKQILARWEAGVAYEAAEFVCVALTEETQRYLNSFSTKYSVRTAHEELNEALVQTWNLEPVAIEFVTEFLPEVDGEHTTVGKLYPNIRRAVSIASTMTCVPCSSINRITTNSFDDRSEEVDFTGIIHDGAYYYVSNLSPRERLQILLEQLGRSESAIAILASLQKIRLAKEADDRLKRVREKQTDAERILELVGEQTIRDLIPPTILDMLEARKPGEIGGEELFKIASTIHGADLVKKLKPALEELGIDTPTSFRGNADALKFIKDIGVSPDYAGEPAEKKKPEREEIMGPVRLPALHEYQQSVSAKIRSLLDGRAAKRGILQLPTGAGKTRVAAESVINHVADSDENQLVIWIAQTEELCEQAVDTWSYVWQGAGASGKRMAVSRLWDGRTAKPEETKLHLVVASIQTLYSYQASRRSEFDWLTKADLVIIDEAHTATTPSYTAVLKWFNRDFRDESNLLLGLTATPFRGSNEEETKRLVNRFGGNLIVPDDFDAGTAHTYLQDLGVLAEVKQIELEGIELKLKDMQSGHNSVDQSSMLEARIDLNQVARSEDRNNRIINHIKEHRNTGTAIVFAASVDHAEALAATLTLEGVPAAAISTRTNPAHRRRLIEEFRREEIQVLTNYDVLSQGFDAPKIGAVYVCRPTFSPNRYIQMVGRGLRGKLNGGSEQVTIINIKDNVEKYGQRLAFTDFDYLWNES
ncbi:DEAD/DEAH box helicase [Arthrobacter alpinus]|uniref:DEAD/DEAH box helicase n=1 Tax=Arthrobacter alpinus TaxID=656366 RepID=UPI001645AB7E|nr:DEAD/DEAH box helicase [Arthrobacter alpinus]